MSVCSLAFLFFCIAVVGVVHLAPGRLPRQLLLACANVLFLALLVPNQRSAAFFAVVLGGSYVALLLVRTVPHRAVVAAAIGLVFFVFLYLKRYDYFATWIPVPFDWNLTVHPVELVGLTYMLFKLIHMFVDQSEGQLARFNLWSYLNYQLSFFTLTAGPIQRYNDFHRCWQEMGQARNEPRENLLLWSRLLAGMIKIDLLSAYAKAALTQVNEMPEPRSLTCILFCFYVYPLYLYFNFSGYTDIMIGSGGLLGFKLPENFNRPYLARNMLDFWDRWHISLTHWIRDYVFMTSYKSAATRFPTAARYWSFGLLFLALFLAGVWHGMETGFVAFGALNGLGAVVTRAYGNGLRARLGHAGLHSYLQNRGIRCVAVLITLHYVCFCHLFFANEFNDALRILQAASSQVLTLPLSLAASEWRLSDAAPLVVAAVAVAALWRADAIGADIRGFAAGIVARPALLYATLCAQTAIVVAFLFFEWAFQQEPPPVRYMAF